VKVVRCPRWRLFNLQAGKGNKTLLKGTSGRTGGQEQEKGSHWRARSDEQDCPFMWDKLETDPERNVQQEVLKGREISKSCHAGKQNPRERWFTRKVLVSRERGEEKPNTGEWGSGRDLGNESLYEQKASSLVSKERKKRRN